MWVFTTIGFFSIVAHRGKPGFVLVRARDRSDLVAFRKALGVLPAPPILATPDADYGFRIVARQAEVATVLDELTRAIDYDNFKNAVAARQGHARADRYHDVWFVVAQLQKQPGRYNRQ